IRVLTVRIRVFIFRLLAGLFGISRLITARLLRLVAILVLALRIRFGHALLRFVAAGLFGLVAGFVLRFRLSVIAILILGLVSRFGLLFSVLRLLFAFAPVVQFLHRILGGVALLRSR